MLEAVTSNLTPDRVGGPFKLPESKETLEEDCQVKFSTSYGVRNPTELPFKAVLATTILYIG